MTTAEATTNLSFQNNTMVDEGRGKYEGACLLEGETEKERDRDTKTWRRNGEKNCPVICM